MISLQEAIYRTIVYFDLFDFAPTLLDIEKWLLQCDTQASSISDIQQILCTDERFQHQEGVYFLRGREQLVNIRKKKYQYTDTKWKHAKPFIRLLAMMPGVEAIWLANSVAWENARQQSDIDLLIITTPGKIWSARFFTAGLMKLLRQRPYEQQPEKALCLSLYIAKDHLNIEPYKVLPYDIHYAFWATQFYPIYDPKNLYQSFQQKNVWIENIFQSIEWTHPIPRRMIHLVKGERLLKKMLTYFCCEPLAKWIQLRIMPNRLTEKAQQKDSGVILSNTLIKLHDNDTRMWYYTQWKQRI
ncbi:MAG TPA: nucleotidyltransferase domain-containing protein [Patescibacteria group bacterium]|nr:nucleotidyltransferase domain-containing protein [Patescibacteria group bacterium]